MNNLDSHFINPVITTPVVPVPENKNASCESTYSKNVTTLDNNLFPFLSLGFDISTIVTHHSVKNLKAIFEKSYYDTELKKEKIRIVWDLLLEDFNFYVLKIYKNSVLFSTTKLIKTDTEFVLNDTFNINDRFDCVLIPVTNDTKEILNKNNSLSFFIIREELKEQQLQISAIKSTSLTSLKLPNSGLSSLSKFLVFNVFFEISRNSLKILFKFDDNSDIQYYKIIFNRIGIDSKHQTEIKLKNFQDVVSIDSFEFQYSYVVAIVPVSKKYGDIFLENNIYDLKFLKLQDKTCSESKIDSSKFKNLIPESFQLETSQNIIGEVHGLATDIVLNLEEPFAQYRLENLRTEFRLSNQVTENFIWSVDDLILAKNTFALKGTKEGFLYALTQSGIDVSDMKFNNIYNGSEVLVKIPTDSPDFLKYIQADRLAQIFLPIYTTFTGVTNCEEIPDMSPARFGWNATTGSKTRVGRSQGELQPGVSKNIYFLLCRKTETSYWNLDVSIESVSNHVIVSELDLTRYKDRYDRDVKLDYMLYDNDVDAPWSSSQGSISMSYLCYWAESEQDILNGICDVDYPEKFREASKHTRQCVNSASFGRAFFGDDLSPVGGAGNITTWTNGIDSQVLGELVVGGSEEPIFKTTIIRNCGLSRNITHSDAILTLDIDESFENSDSLTTNIFSSFIDLSRPSSLVLDYNATTGTQILDDFSGNQTIHTTITSSVSSIWSENSTLESYEKGLSFDDSHGYSDTRSLSTYMFSAVLGNSLFGDDFSPLSGFKRQVKITNGLGSITAGNYKFGGGSIVKRELGGFDSFVDVTLGGNLYPFEKSVEIISDDQHKLIKVENYKPEYVHRKTGGNLTDLSIEFNVLYNHVRTHDDLTFVNHDITGSRYKLGYNATFDTVDPNDYADIQSIGSTVRNADLCIYANTQDDLNNCRDSENVVVGDSKHVSICQYQAITGKTRFGDDLAPLGGRQATIIPVNDISSMRFGFDKLGGYEKPYYKLIFNTCKLVKNITNSELFDFSESFEIDTLSTQTLTSELKYLKQPTEFGNIKIGSELGFVSWESSSSRATTADLNLELPIEFDAISTSDHVSDFVYEGFEFETLHSTSRVSTLDCTREVYATVAFEVVITDTIIDYDKWPFTSFRTLKLSHYLFSGNNNGYGIYNSQYNPTYYMSLDSITKYSTRSSQEII